MRRGASKACSKGARPPRPNQPIMPVGPSARSWRRHQARQANRLRQIGRSCLFFAALSGCSRDTPRGRDSIRDSTHTQAPPPPMTESVALAADSGSRRVGVFIGRRAIWLDSTTMRDVNALLGGNALIYKSEGLVALNCFKSLSRDPVFLTVEAHHSDTLPIVTVVLSRSAPSSKVYPRCTSIEETGTAIRTTLHVQLGMKRASVERVLGIGQALDANVLQYTVGMHSSNEGKSIIPRNAVQVVLTFAGDDVVEISLSQGNEFLSR